jgi:hypothetical protein
LSEGLASGGRPVTLDYKVHVPEPLRPHRRIADHLERPLLPDHPLRTPIAEAVNNRQVVTTGRDPVWLIQ